MIVYAKEPDRVTRIGGWGYLLEHGGSGYAIGRDAIRAALDDSEGTGPATSLSRLVAERAAMPLERLVLEVYRRDPAFVASFAPLVFDADAADDAVAKGILSRNVRLFAETLNHAAEAYDCGDTVVVSGGVASNVRFGELLRRELKAGLRLVVPSCPQSAGSCFNCARFCGVESPALHERLAKEYMKC